MSGGCCPLLLFWGLVISLCGVWNREDVGGWPPCCLGWVGHLRYFDVDPTSAY
ncbi:hypothetical protein PR003_g18895 [Phytophthora rubi]|uniref:RxLR effector protein n=1 Tax=Phytophthora rubi TaxID=129364 RepID=A0A6A4EA22_9STRA|nr:hypothetical protein PR002_g18699 [Phytophthora rubi]KAE9003764.1 hypothetical protein PR001_g17886 [Phytophthora rubi]KAE9315783.1 hypothetical protein PR003_g18895 [Phytophthora rubi]